MFVKNGRENSTTLTFLGIEFDTIKMELRLPKEKLSEIKDRLIIILNSRRLKLREIQSVIGLLNFACQLVVPGKAFCRRLIDATCNVKTAWQSSHYQSHEGRFECLVKMFRKLQW